MMETTLTQEQALRLRDELRKDILALITHPTDPGRWRYDVGPILAALLQVTAVYVVDFAEGCGRAPDPDRRFAQIAEMCGVEGADRELTHELRFAQVLIGQYCRELIAEVLTRAQHEIEERQQPAPTTAVIH